MVTINITTFNRKKLTDVCINSLISSTKREQFELIVVDNNSTDETVPMLREMKRNGIIDKLILNKENKHLGAAVNQAWNIAAPSSKWVIWCNNDFFFMNGWLDNLKKVIKCTGIDYVSCLYLEGLIRNKISPGIPKICGNGGTYLEQTLRPKKKFDVGSAPAVSRSALKKYNIRVSERPFEKGYTGPGPSFYRQLYQAGLKGVRLDKPAILRQDPEFNNPEYRDYYKMTYESRGLNKVLKLYQRKGFAKNLKQYYSR
jgi:glycosyltransferase involved in cell wall biosynthesis